LRFVVIGVAVQSRDALLNRLPEPRTDFESILGSALDRHESTSERESLRPKFFRRRPQVSSLAADTTEAPFSAPDYGVAHLR
jgi:hypothetical protein